MIQPAVYHLFLPAPGIALRCSFSEFLFGGWPLRAWCRRTVSRGWNGLNRSNKKPGEENKGVRLGVVSNLE